MQTVQSNVQLSTNAPNAIALSPNKDTNKAVKNKLNESRLKENKQEIKKRLRQLLKETLMTAKESRRSERVSLVRQGLNAIQVYCQSVGKTFIFCELKITCDEYDLNGSQQQSATLFRGPSENASVAICVTDKGSLLHRNDSRWTVYCDAGDVGLTDLRCLRTPA